MRRYGRHGHPAAVLCLLVLGACAAMAQPSTPELTPGERARRDAEKVFQWIRMHADTPRRPREEKAEKVEKVEKAATPPPRAAAKTEPARDAGRDEPAAARAEAPKEAREASQPRTEPQRSAHDVAAAAQAPARAASPPQSSAALHRHAGAASMAAAPVAGASAAAATAEPLTHPQAASAAQTVAVAPPSVPASVPAAIAATGPASAAAPDEDEDEPLVLEHQVEPDFPGTLVRQLHRGKVQVRFTVRPDGTVEQPEVVSSSHRRMNAPALDAVAQWRFKPVRQARLGVVELGFSLD